MATTPDSPSFFARISLAFRLLGDAKLASRLTQPEKTEQVAPSLKVPVLAQVPEPSPAAQHASALALLGLLQREGRFVDFLQEDVAPFSDAEIGAAARVVHAGCSKALSQYLKLEPAFAGSDGSPVTLPAGYDSQRIRLSGNVTGEAPYKGTLRHHGWVATEVRLPVLSDAIDPKVIAPADVEL